MDLIEESSATVWPCQTGREFRTEIEGYIHRKTKTQLRADIHFVKKHW